MATSIPVHDFRGMQDPSPEEAARLEAARAADEAARREAAARKHGHLYRPAPAHMPVAQLSSGGSMPLVGLGTWKSAPGEVKGAVVEALRAGYRHIDCAAVYANEHEVGEALEQVFAEGVVARGDVFVTSKLWNSEHGAARARAACLKTLKDLRLDYLDLYLIHWPHSSRSGPTVQPPFAETWAALEGLVSEGLVRAIGLSNFSPKKAAALMEGASVMPAVLQVEAHPYWRNQALIDWAASKGIHVTAYSPLGSPDSAAIMKRAADTPKLLEDAKLAAIAAKLGKSPAAVLIRWAVQRGTSVLPKSVSPERIAANLDVTGWSIPGDDFDALSSLEPQMRMLPGDFVIDPANGPYRSRAELWDE